MFENLQSDRDYLENKYHRQDQPFDPYVRMAYHGYEYDPSTGDTDEEIKEGLRRLEATHGHLPRPVFKAMAVEYVLDHTRIDVNEHDWFVGVYTWNRAIGDVTVRKWDRELFEKTLPEDGAQMALFNRSGAVNMWVDYDHIVPDWEALMNLGFPGILERARTWRRHHETKGALTDEQKAYFDGIEIEYSATIRFLDRLHAYALKQTHAKAPAIATSLAHLRDGAPQNTYDALQLMYLYFMVSESVDFFQVRSLGNGLDHTLLPFWEKDLQNGVAREELCELLGYFFMQFSAIGNYWGQPFYLGGTFPDGSTRVNHLSYDILNTYRALHIYNPKIQIKVNTNTPIEFWNLTLDIARSGEGALVFCCEPGHMRAVMSYGASFEEALDMDFRGCYETGVRANEISTADAYINLLKSVLYVLSDGYDVKTGEQVGIHTGKLSDFATFEDFYSAVQKQLSSFIERVIASINRIEAHLEEVNPSSLYSATVEHSLKNARDGYAGGVKYNNTAILCCGFGSFVDSLMAVKEFVYDTHTLSLEELALALERNWQGYELLQKRIKNSPHKYGNGDEETDRYAQALSHWLSGKINYRPNARGGIYKSCIHTAMQFVWQGEQTGATPDGRMAGEEYSKNASPTPGMDRGGVTALLRSSLALSPYLWLESFCTDVMLHPSAVSGEGGLAAMRALVMAYMEGGGMSIQFNVFQTKSLRDAQKNPDRYRNLQVRICGWNALWNNVPAPQQEAYIRRLESYEP